MKLKFTAETFNGLSPYETTKQEFADRANAKFDQWLEAQVVVYGTVDEKGVFFFCDPKAVLSDKNCSHRARLVNIEPIEKVECTKHEPMYDAPADEHYCYHCRLPIEATWKVKS